MNFSLIMATILLLKKCREYGLDFSGFTTQTAFFDYDHDGDLDCYILNQSHHPHAKYCRYKQQERL